jgi:hypothetical protein|tara:strand:+ start:12194 stop:12427 length:234 start_codon:yes stop_codon:yes gene_type:complete
LDQLTPTIVWYNTDPFCNQTCLDAFKEQIHREMDLMSAMSDQEFYEYMMPSVQGQELLAQKFGPAKNDSVNWRRDGF